MRRPAGCLLVVLVLGTVQFGTGAAPARAADSSGTELLTRAAGAALTQAYSGRQLVRAGSHTTVVDVRCWPGRGVQVQAVPGVTRTVADPVDAGSLLPDSRAFEVLTANYRVEITGRAVVAGRGTRVVELRRRNGNVLAARLWIDDATVLPLRRDVLDDRGRVTRSSTFTTFRPGVPDGAAPDLPAATGTSLSAAGVDALRAAGTAAPEGLPGGLRLVDARTLRSPAGTLQLSYSDGLTTLSVFQQPGRLDTAALAGWVRRQRAGHEVWAAGGNAGRVSWSAADRVYTLVSDDPAVVDGAVAVLPRPARTPGVLRRIGHGVARVGSWMNPFA